MSPMQERRGAPHPGESRSVRIRVVTSVRSLFVVAALLVAIHLLGLVSTYGFDHGRVFGLIRFFHLDHEGNLPTWFSSVLAFLSAGLFFELSRRGRSSERRRCAWLSLSLLFVYLSIDEVAVIHEALIIPVRESLGLSGPLYFAWVLPYGAAVAVLAAILWPFFRRLGPKHHRRFMIAAAAYLSGALGMELVGGWLFEASGEQRHLAYDLITTVEEVLEIGGLILLIRAQLLLLAEQSAIPGAPEPGHAEQIS